jgi:hypothetical protein
MLTLYVKSYANHVTTRLCQDSENNTILMLLADTKPPPPDPYIAPCMQQHDMAGAILRMARLYIDRYPRILDWSNTQGRTALHLASLKGNEELARVLFCPCKSPLLTFCRCFVILVLMSIWQTTPVIRRFISE